MLWSSNKLLSIGSNFSCHPNSKGHSHLWDLVTHFSLLADEQLHLIWDSKECFISHRSRIYLVSPGIPYASVSQMVRRRG